MTSVLADTIPGIRVVKAFAQESREVERFNRANRRVLDDYRPRQRPLVVSSDRWSRCSPTWGYWWYVRVGHLSHFPAAKSSSAR